MNENFKDGFEKIAKDQKLNRGDIRRGLSRARTERRDGTLAKGFSRFLKNEDLHSDQMVEGAKGTLKGLGYGAAGGAALGLIASLASRGKLMRPIEGAEVGATLGGFAGSGIGALVGANKAEKKYLKERGITYKPFSRRPHFDEKARKKYIENI